MNNKNNIHLNPNNISNPLVTIGIPVYNLPLKVFKTLFNQVLNQTYTNLDILVVDDGSKLRCQTIKFIHECANRDKRIRFFRNKQNMGIAYTRQIIVNNILGDYFIFIDGDDYIELNFIDSMIAPLLNSVDVAAISCCMIKTLGDKTKNKKIIQKYDSNILEHFFKGRFTTALYNKMLPSSIASTLVFDESRGQEDVSVMIDIFKQCAVVFRLFDTVYYYRKRRNSLSNSGSRRMAYLVFLSSKYNYEKAKELCVDEKIVGRLFAIYKLNEYVLSCIKYSKQDHFKQNTITAGGDHILKELRVILSNNCDIQDGYLRKIRFVIKHPWISKMFYSIKYRNK